VMLRLAGPRDRAQCIMKERPALEG
jgi:hypothetical protein